MKKQEVTITIMGKSGTGKTTLGRLIHAMLCEHGFESELDDVDGSSLSVLDDDRFCACVRSLPEQIRIRIVPARKPKP